MHCQCGRIIPLQDIPQRESLSACHFLGPKNHESTRWLNVALDEVALLFHARFLIGVVASNNLDRRSNPPVHHGTIYIWCNRDESASTQGLGAETFKLLPLGPERVLIIPEEVRYNCIPHEGVRHLWIHFSMEGGRATAPGGPWEIRLDRHAEQVWAKLYAEVKRARGGAIRILRHDCSAALIGALGRIKDEGVADVSPRLRQLLSWLERSLGNPPSLDEMVARSGMGRRSFLRWFRRETGYTPVTFLTRRRILEACRLLRFGTDSIEQIAEATGFANRHHFTRTFAAHTGRGPSAFKKGL